MKTFFSLAQLGFFPESMKPEYDAAGTWPLDAVEVSQENENTLRAAISNGSTILRVGEAWGFTAPPFETIAAPRLASFRQNREVALNRLNGLGFAALLSGNAEQAEEIASVRASLLDVPTLPQVQAAATLQNLDAALDTAWRGAYAGSESTEIAAAMAVGAGGGQTRPS